MIYVCSPDGATQSKYAHILSKSEYPPFGNFSGVNKTGREAEKRVGWMKSVEKNDGNTV